MGWLESVLSPYVRLRNALDYPIRRRIRPRRPIDVTPEQVELSPEARRLVERYELTSVVETGRRRDVLENLYYLVLLETAFEQGGVSLPPGRVEAIDVGVSHWFYAPALHALLRR